MTVMVKEAAGKTGKLTGSRMEITLITPGWGSSGYYSAETLEKAAKDRVFPRKTQMHIDHEQDGGVGSVSTLAAYLNEDARWDPSYTDPDTGVKGRLVAEARATTKWGTTLAELAEAIGTSIAAPAKISLGEAEGRQGKIIEELVPGILNRVDFVTVAGRGGRIQEVLESANPEPVQEARNVGMWLEARMHSMFTNMADEMFGDGRMTREERITLSAALGQALTSFTATVESEAPQLFERDLWDDPVSPAATEAAPTDSAPNPAAVTKNQEGANMATIEDKDLADLRESAGRATVAEADLSKANERANATEAALKESNDEAATELVNHALESAGLTAPKLAARLAEGYPVKENGVIDRAKLAETVAESVAELQVANGAGSVRTVGESQEQTKVELTKESAEAAILAVSGYTPKGAK